VGVYQLSMALDDYFIRGAISVGELFLDPNTAFGPALLEAHDLESNVARDPRVILAPGVSSTFALFRARCFGERGRSLYP
jgi:hypothetical protein